MQNLRKPVESEQCIYSRNKMSSHVEGIGSCSLVLSSGFVLELEKNFYISSLSSNLISASRLISLGYSFQFLENSFNLYYKYDVVGNSILSDSLFSLKLQNDATHNAMHVQTSIK